MFHRYDYEAEYYPSLSRLPLDLRRKLDISGVKLSLKDWLAISLEERTVLCHLPCDHDEERQAFATYLDFLAKKYLGTPAEKTAPMNIGSWSESAVPGAVATAKCSEGPSGDADRMAPLAIAPSLCALQNRNLQQSTGSL